MTDEPFILGANLRDTRPQITAGISRNMQIGIDAYGAAKLDLAPVAQGGGNLNGSAQTVHMAGGSVGGNGTRWQMPRQNKKNFTGIV